MHRTSITLFVSRKVTHSVYLFKFSVIYNAVKNATMSLNVAKWLVWALCFCDTIVVQYKTLKFDKVKLICF